MNVKQLEQMLSLTDTLTKLISGDNLDSYDVSRELNSLTAALRRELKDQVWHQYCKERGINA